MKSKYILLVACVTLLSGCGSRKPATTSTNSRYTRQPIIETTEHQLRLENMMTNAKLQQELGNIKEAMQLYRQLTDSSNTYAPAYFEMGRLYHAQGRPDSALACARRAVELDDNNVWYKLSLANVYEDLHNGKQLISTWERIVAQHPDNINYYYSLSDAYLKTNDVIGAINVLNRVEKKIGITEMVSVQKQKMWEAIGKSDKAQKEIEALAEAMPQETHYNATLAELNMRQKNYAKAKVYYDRVLKADPNNEYIHISLAEYYKAVNQPDKAFSELKQGFLNPRLDAKSKLQILGNFYTNEEFYGSRSKESFELMDIIMKQCEDTTTYALFYADVLMRQEKYPEAYRQLKIHLSADSSQYEVWEALLICESMMGDRDTQMIEDSRRAAALFPLHPLPYYLQGAYATHHKDYKTGLEMLEQCEKLGFERKYLQNETLGLLGLCHYNLGNLDKAWHYFEITIKEFPDDIVTLNNYAYYLSEKDTLLNHALEMSAKTIQKEPDNPTYLDTYAWILHQQGKDKEALPYIDKALKLSTDPSETLKSHQEIIHNALK